MPVKRQNHGRSKKNRGSVRNVRCVNCGACVPKDKSLSKTSNNYSVEASAHEDLQAKSIYPKLEVPISSCMEYYCVSCACHLRIVTVRPKIHRKDRNQDSKPHVKPIYQ